MLSMLGKEFSGWHFEIFSYFPQKTGLDISCKLSTKHTLHKMSNSVFFGKVDICVEVLRPSQPSGVMLSTVSLPNHTFTGQA